MPHARLAYLWRRLLVCLRLRSSGPPDGWERVTPLEADPEYLDLLIWWHATDPAWYLRMTLRLPGRDSP